MSKKKEKEQPEKPKSKPKGMSAHRKTISDLKSYNFKITTGSLIFDVYLDGGYKAGLARFGAEPEHGKTLQCLTWIYFWKKYWGKKCEVHYWDAEGRVTPEKLKAAHFDEFEDLDEWFNLYVYNVYEDIGDEIFNLTSNNDEEKRIFFVFDSLDMMVSKQDLTKTLDENMKIASGPTVTTNLIKKVGPYIAANGHHLHVLSQIRANINTSNPNSPQTKLSGGFALKHAASLVGEIQKNWAQTYIFENPDAVKVADKGKIIGHYHTIKFTKTPHEKTGQTIQIPILYGRGIWREREVVDIALAYGMISKKSAWYTIGNDEMTTEINKDLTESRKKSLEESYKARIKAEDDKDKKEKLTKELEKNLKKEKFELIPLHQGFTKLFAYFEENPDLIDWMEKEIRNTLLPKDETA